MPNKRNKNNLEGIETMLMSVVIVAVFLVLVAKIWKELHPPEPMGPITCLHCVHHKHNRYEDTHTCKATTYVRKYDPVTWFTYTAGYVACKKRNRTGNCELYKYIFEHLQKNPPKVGID